MPLIELPPRNHGSYHIFYTEGKYGIKDLYSRQRYTDCIFDHIEWCEPYVKFRLNGKTALYPINKIGNLQNPEERQRQIRLREEDEACYLNRAAATRPRFDKIHKNKRIVYSIHYLLDSYVSPDSLSTVEYYGMGKAIDPNLPKEKQTAIDVFKFKDKEGKCRFFITLDDILLDEGLKYYQYYACRENDVKKVLEVVKSTGNIPLSHMDLKEGTATPFYSPSYCEIEESYTRWNRNRNVYIVAESLKRTADEVESDSYNYYGINGETGHLGYSERPIYSYYYEHQGSLHRVVEEMRLYIKESELPELVGQFFSKHKYIKLNWIPLFLKYKEEWKFEAELKPEFRPLANPSVISLSAILESYSQTQGFAGAPIKQPMPEGKMKSQEYYSREKQRIEIENKERQNKVLNLPKEETHDFHILYRTDFSQTEIQYMVDFDVLD